ncbi:MAG: Glucose 1-dehydrogenase 1 [Chlamydiales bacterium]|nr:Glucose 1-dehydrogenase 1 [Chlamydiales bacterium]
MSLFLNRFKSERIISRMGECEDKVVVVTGGSSGIGKAIATKFNVEGAKVAIFGRNQEKLDTTLRSLDRSIAVQGDVGSVTDLDNLFKTTQDQLGSIDTLIVNAGIAEKRHISEVDEAFFDAIIKTNYKGAFFTAQRSLPFLNSPASILFISSIACHSGWPSHSVYSSSKAAVSMLARSFSCDLIKQGVRVNAISPGYTDTPLFDSLKENQPEAMQEREQKIPVRRFAQPNEIAEAAFFLSSVRAGYIAGVDLVVDGGVISHQQGSSSHGPMLQSK